MLITGLTTVNSAIYPRALPQLTLKKWCSLHGSVSVSDLWMRAGAGLDRLSACLKSTGSGCNWESRPPFCAKAWPDQMPEVFERDSGRTFIGEHCCGTRSDRKPSTRLKFLSCLSSEAASFMSPLCCDAFTSKNRARHCELNLKKHHGTHTHRDTHSFCITTEQVKTLGHSS